MAFALISCHKGDQGSAGVNNPLRQLIAQNRAAAEQQFVLNAGSGGQVFGAKGTIITVGPNAFRTNSGAVVSGNVTVRLLEAYSPADMVWLNMRTVAMAGTQKVALQSGGEIRLRAEANGEQVTVAPGMAQVYFADDQLDPLMREFRGEEDMDGDILWEDVGDLDADTGVVILDSLGGQGWLPGNYYNAPWPANAFGDPNWPNYAFINCDHPMPPNGDSTDVTVLVPQSDGSTMVWIVLPEIDCMVYMELPVAGGIRAGCPVRIGLQGTIVALRQEGGLYYSAFVPVTITDGLEESIVLQPTTLTTYQQALQAL